MKKKKEPDNQEPKFCECGCGEVVISGRKFKQGHHMRVTKDHPMRRPEVLEKYFLGDKNSSKRPEVREKLSKLKSGENHHFFGKHLTEEHKKKVSEGNKGKTFSDETIKKLSDSMKLAWKDDKNREKWTKQFNDHLNRLYHTVCMFRNRDLSINDAEKRLLDIINKDQILWKFCGDFKIIVNGKSPDFIYMGNNKLFIELWGDGWHKYDSEEDRKDLFTEFGFRTLIIKSSELIDEKDIIRRVNEFISLGG